VIVARHSEINFGKKRRWKNAILLPADDAAKALWRNGLLDRYCRRRYSGVNVCRW
jgi:hypothetical protein